FRIAVDPEPEEGFHVQILARESGTSVLLADWVAELPGVAEASDEAELRAALTAGGIAMNGADDLFFLPEESRARLHGSADAAHVRRLSAADAAAFAAFTERAPEADVDEAYVELDHWAVFGAFDGDEIVAAGSAYPFDEDTLLADLGVLTLPSHRGRGHAREVIHALARHALAEGFEPQYRCQIDNTSSVILAGRAGFQRLGTWDVPLPA
ncbi:GNAT family N-acetyltransferase, partial [Leucobacter sp. M11]|uniref:GNAT family N-acetyltransferase n=1 Tax=Leucobacter sp. M11 TaxID=2993565 RepID=UPI002D802A90